MAGFNVPSDYNIVEEDVSIRDNVSEFSYEDEEEQFDGSGPSNYEGSSSSNRYYETFDTQIIEHGQFSNPFQNIGSQSLNVSDDLYEGMKFDSKQAVVNAIKQYHIKYSFNYVIQENKSHVYVARCKQNNEGCQWRVRAAFSKNKNCWMIKKKFGLHSCTTSHISQDHDRLDSSFIASNVVDIVRVNPSIRIKTLIADIQTRFGYSVTYKKAWMAKQKALELAFGGWEESYTFLPKWMAAVQDCLPGTIVRYKTTPMMHDGEDEPSSMMLNRVFWAFKPSIEGFKFCKPVVQVDGTFLTGKYHGTLLTAIAQDGNRNIFPLAFAVVESESKEAWMWFMHYLRRHVTPQPNLCIISDRGTGLLAALRSERVGWAREDVTSVYCIRHIALNFNKHFKNSELKQQIINMAYEIMPMRFEAKFLAIKSEFRQAAEWLEEIPREKWTQAYDGGKRYGHMTTNLAECINSVLKSARAFPITALVQETFAKLTDLFVINGTQIRNMLSAGYRYCEEVSVMLNDNRRISSSHHVRKFTRDNAEFEVKELANTQRGRRAMTYKVNLNERWCQCGQFQALHVPCSHVIAACAYCNLCCDDFVDDVYKLENIYKCYEQEFHPVGNELHWHAYPAPQFLPDPSKRRETAGRPSTTRIHNEMDQPTPNQPKKCSLCRTQGHNKSNCPYKNVNV